LDSCLQIFLALSIRLKLERRTQRGNGNRFSQRFKCLKLTEIEVRHECKWAKQRKPSSPQKKALKRECSTIE
jgi:hypothetical protein